MKEAVLMGEAFNRLIDATKPFIQSDSAIRRMYTLIKMDFSASESTATAIACNGYMLSVQKELLIDAPDENFTVYIKPVAKLPAKSFVSVALYGEDCLIRSGDTITGYKQPKFNEEFLDWQKAMQGAGLDNPEFRIGFDPDLLIAALKAEKACRRDRYEKKPVILSFTTSRQPVFMTSGENGVRDGVRMVLPVRIREEYE